MVLDIIKYADSNYIKLRSKNVDVIKDNPFLQELIDNMFDTLEFNDGIGLAAPQVGYNLNLFVVKTSNLKEVFMNPEILLEGLSIQNIETCLSLPGLKFAANRRERIK